MLAKDSKIVLPFYGFLCLSIWLGIYQIPNYQYFNRQIAYLLLGFLWFCAGFYVARSLQQLYQKRFWALQGQQQKFILIAILVAGLGGGIFCWTIWRLLTN